MSDKIEILLGVDTTELDADLLVVQGAMDDTVKSWEIKRRQVMQGVAVANQMMQIMARMAQRTTDATGKAVLQILRTLQTAVSMSTSVLLAIAAGYTATGILSGVGAVLAGFAAGLSIGETAAIADAEHRVQEQLNHIRSRLTSVESGNNFRVFMTGGF